MNFSISGESRPASGAVIQRNGAPPSRTPLSAASSPTLTNSAPKSLSLLTHGHGGRLAGDQVAHCVGRDGQVGGVFGLAAGAEMLDAAHPHLQSRIFRFGPEAPQVGLVGAHIQGQAAHRRVGVGPVGDHAGDDVPGVVAVPQVFGIHIDGGTGGDAADGRMPFTALPSASLTLMSIKNAFPQAKGGPAGTSRRRRSAPVAVSTGRTKAKAGAFPGPYPATGDERRASSGSGTAGGIWCRSWRRWRRGVPSPARFPRGTSG